MLKLKYVLMRNENSDPPRSDLSNCFPVSSLPEGFVVDPAGKVRQTGQPITTLPPTLFYIQCGTSAYINNGTNVAADFGTSSTFRYSNEGKSITKDFTYGNTQQAMFIKIRP